MIDYGAIISLLIACSIIYKFSLPVLKKAVQARRVEFIRSKFALQNQLKNVRNKYEQANYFYLQSFERKITWTVEAEQILENKLKTINEKHKTTMNDLHKQYVSDLKQIEQINKKNYIEDLINIMAKKMHEKDMANEYNYVKILENLEE